MTPRGGDQGPARGGRTGAGHRGAGAGGAALSAHSVPVHTRRIGASLIAHTAPMHTRRILPAGPTRRPLTVCSYCTRARPWEQASVGVELVTMAKQLTRLEGVVERLEKYEGIRTGRKVGPHRCWE